MASFRSPYETLNVSADAESVVIEAAYKALIKKYHPDLWLDDPNAQGRAATINEAFAILRNPESRSLCDQQLRAMRNAAQAATFQQAAFQQARSRPRGARWWTGWLAAIIIAAAQFVPWDEIGVPAARLASRSAPARVTAATVAEPSTKASARAQPERPLPDSLVQLVAEARERQAAFLKTLDAEPAPPAAQQNAQPPARQPLARNRNQSRTRAPAAERPAEPDFLEREGYIY